MGSRLASLRRPDAVVVMAPALTEAGQSQNLKLPPPASHSSPISVFKNKLSVSKLLLSDAHLICAKTGTTFDLVARLGHKNNGVPCSVAGRKNTLYNKPKEEEVGGSPTTGGPQHMMNNSDPSMGDHREPNTMGLHKSNLTEAANFLKDKPSDVDQLLGPGDLMGQSVDELLQAIKCPLGLLGSEGAEGLEPEGMFPDLTSLERDLLGDVEGMLCEETRETQAKTRLEDVGRRQFELERRMEWLMRRLRKLQARAMGRHAAEEAAGLLERAAGGAGVSTPALVRRLDMLSQQQAAMAARNHSPARYFGSGAPEPSQPGPRAGILPRLDMPVEVDRVSGQLHTQLRLVEGALDSDVTASSSGGESCDETQAFNNQHQVPLTIAKRAAWHWGQERAEVARRWTWLQAQISDLEYRIRQHNEIHRQVRGTKGGVVLADPQGATPTAAAAAGAAPVVVNGFHGVLPGGKTAEDAAAPLAGCCTRTRPLVRSAFRKRKLLQTLGLHAASKKAARPSTVRCGCQEPLAWCALCTGRADPTAPQKQQLLTIPERVGLLDPSFHPVLSFTQDIAQGIHLDAMMKTPDWQQKVMRVGVKVTKAALKGVEKDPGRSRNSKYTRLKKVAVNNNLTAKIKRKLTKGRKPKSHDQSSLHPLQRLKRKRQLPRAGLSLPNPGERFGEDANLEGVAGGSKHPSPSPSPCLPGMLQFRGDILRMKPECVTALCVRLGRKLKSPVACRRKRENSYDIDNIVIPHSIAAATRVEKLQYKEIPTPKWRTVEAGYDKLEVTNNGLVRRFSQEEETEDISDEAVLARHERCEVEEKKKFMSYMKNPHSCRSRGNRRTDSRAESSGANTPDPMSPLNLETPGSPMASPPPTPLPLDPGEGSSSGSQFRKRTVSQTRLVLRETELNIASSDLMLAFPHDELYNMVPPYESRTFPLLEDIYQSMLRDMPEGHPYTTLPIKSILTKDSEECRPSSPNSDSTESAPGEEDPNDPEWTSVKR